MTTLSASTYGSLSDPGCWAWTMSDGQWRLGSRIPDSPQANEEVAILDVLRFTAFNRGPLRILVQDRFLAERLESSLTGDLRSAVAGREVMFAWAGIGQNTAPAVLQAPLHGRTKPLFKEALVTNNLREQIIYLESSLLSAETRLNQRLLEQMIHHDFYEIGRTGRYWEREEVIQVLNTLSDQVQNVSFDRVTELASGVAHVRFRTEDVKGVVHRSSIWMNEDGHWRQLYHQGTPDTQIS